MSLHTDNGENLSRKLYNSKQYVVNTCAQNLTKQVLLDIKPQDNPDTVIMDDFNTPL